MERLEITALESSVTYSSIRWVCYGSLFYLCHQYSILNCMILLHLGVAIICMKQEPGILMYSRVNHFQLFDFHLLIMLKIVNDRVINYTCRRARDLQFSGCVFVIVVQWRWTDNKRTHLARTEWRTISCTSCHSIVWILWAKGQYKLSP